MDLNNLRNRVQRFVERTWGPRSAGSRWERSICVTEEAIELAQAEGHKKELILALVERVFSRPLGNPTQEYAGVGVTWLIGTSTTALDPMELLEWEIHRIEEIDPLIFRTKQSEKAKLGFGLPPFKE